MVIVLDAGGLAELPRVNVSTAGIRAPMNCAVRPTVNAPDKLVCSAANVVVVVDALPIVI